MKIEALLFDLDGTVVDSEPVHFSSWSEILSAFDVELSAEVYAREFSGVSIVTVADNLISRSKLDISLESLISLKENRYMNRIENGEVRLMPYAIEILDFFNERNVPLGLVTSSSRKEVNIILKSMGLEGYFRVLVTRDDVKEHKPHPAPYLKSVNSFGFDASNYIVFEDSGSGVRSAKAANLRCFAINPNHAELAKLEAEADLVFFDLYRATKYILENHF